MGVQARACVCMREREREGEKLGFLRQCPQRYLNAGYCARTRVREREREFRNGKIAEMMTLIIKNDQSSHEYS